MKNSQKGFVVPIIIAIIALLGIGGGAYFYLNKDQNQIKYESELNAPSQVANNKMDEYFISYDDPSGPKRVDVYNVAGKKIISHNINPAIYRGTRTFAQINGNLYYPVAELGYAPPSQPGSSPQYNMPAVFEILNLFNGEKRKISLLDRPGLDIEDGKIAVSQDEKKIAWSISTGKIFIHFIDTGKTIEINPVENFSIDGFTYHSTGYPKVYYSGILTFLDNNNIIYSSQGIPEKIYTIHNIETNEKSVIKKNISAILNNGYFVYDNSIISKTPNSEGKLIKSTEYVLYNYPNKNNVFFSEKSELGYGFNLSDFMSSDDNKLLFFSRSKRDWTKERGFDVSQILKYNVLNNTTEIIKENLNGRFLGLDNDGNLLYYNREGESLDSPLILYSENMINHKIVRLDVPVFGLQFIQDRYNGNYNFKIEKNNLTPNIATSTIANVSTSASSSTINNKIITEAKNCVSDLNCFVEAIKTCTSAKFNRSTTAQILGSTVETNIDFALVPRNLSCEMEIKLNKYYIRASDELLADAKKASNAGDLNLEKTYQELNQKSIGAIGKIGLCNITELKKSFIDFFNKKETDFMYGDGWLLVNGADLKCSGELFSLLKM